jgi:hypothetical protein
MVTSKNVLVGSHNLIDNKVTTRVAVTASTGGRHLALRPLRSERPKRKLKEMVDKAFHDEQGPIRLDRRLCPKHQRPGSVGATCQLSRPPKICARDHGQLAVVGSHYVCL